MGCTLSEDAFRPPSRVEGFSDFDHIEYDTEEPVRDTSPEAGEARRFTTELEGNSNLADTVKLESLVRRFSNSAGGIRQFGKAA